jgi:hypothetical protein
MSLQIFWQIFLNLSYKRKFLLFVCCCIFSVFFVVVFFSVVEEESVAYMEGQFLEMADWFLN